MKNLRLYLGIFALYALLTSCTQEDGGSPVCNQDSPIGFTIDYIENPDNVIYTYESPDPCHIHKFHELEANLLPSEVLLSCTNADQIFFEMPEEELVSDLCYINESQKWSATIENGKDLKFDFMELETAPELPFDPVDVMVATIKDGKKLKDSIRVWRIWNK